MPLPPVVKLANGRIDNEYEREIATIWLKEKHIEWSHLQNNSRKGFYLLKKGKRENKVFMCCSSNIGYKSRPHFWFGLDHSQIRTNPDTGLILICTWEDRFRDYICFPNSFVRLWTQYWYNKNDYYSIDIDIKFGKYLMKYPKDSVYVDDYVNNILKVFEKINFLIKY